MNQPVLDVRNLSVRFPNAQQPLTAVKNLSFTLHPGQTLGIVGESGSGKSVTALAVMGLVPESGDVDGQLWFCGRQMREPVDLRSLREKELTRYRGSHIAMIFQEPQSSLNPVYTCGFQLIEVLRQHQRLTPARAEIRAGELLQEVRLLPTDEQLRDQIQHSSATPLRDALRAVSDHREIQQQIQRQKKAMLNRYPHQLSGGQLQRVMIAMAIATEPDILIADEPTTALDVTVQASILKLLRELQQRHQMAMIFITHDLGLMAELADHVAVMYRGEMVEMGTVANLFAHPQHPYTQGLLACRPPNDQRLVFLPTLADFLEETLLPDGRRQLTAKPSAGFSSRQALEPTAIAQRLEALQQQSPLLRVEGLSVRFPVRGSWGQTQQFMSAVQDLSFVIYPGETLGLVGESGCGKTTLARTILRLNPPSQGQIWFEGQNVATLKGLALQQFRRDVQLVFQDPLSALDPRLTIGAAIMEPMQIHSRQNNPQRNRDRAAYLLERVGLTPSAMNRYPHEFSGGQRQRICIARALALNPKLLICDESVSALDVSVQAQVLNLLKELQQDFALTYLFISHDLSVVRFMSDRMMVMNHGQLEEIGAADTIYQNPQRPYTQQLIAAIPKP
jgi:peptide/nickel transport system ATP-binding protein